MFARGWGRNLILSIPDIWGYGSRLKRPGRRKQLLRLCENSYFTAEKRLSNELACTIGAEPATTPSLAAGAGADAAWASETVGFSGGRAEACFVSGFAASGFATSGFDGSSFNALGAADVSWRGAGSLRLASITFGFAGIGCALAVGSAGGALATPPGARVAGKPARGLRVGVPPRAPPGARAGVRSARAAPPA